MGGDTERVALGVFGFMFFGYGLGYLSYMTNDPNYRPIMLMIFLTTELNDVFAYVTGHLFGKRKMAPLTSPNKTMGGAVGVSGGSSEQDREIAEAAAAAVGAS